MDADFDRIATTGIRVPRRNRIHALAAIVLGVGGPIGVYEIRGPCWEGLLGSLVGVAIALALIRPPLSLWLTVVLVMSVGGSVGLIGWSRWRFDSVNVFSSYSPRLAICGRDYQPEGPTFRKLPVAFKDLTQHVMGVTPSGSAIIGTGCQTTVLFVVSPGPNYRSYDLLGGP